MVVWLVIVARGVNRIGFLIAVDHVSYPFCPGASGALSQNSSPNRSATSASSASASSTAAGPLVSTSIVVSFRGCQHQKTHDAVARYVQTVFSHGCIRHQSLDTSTSLAEARACRPFSLMILISRNSGLSLKCFNRLPRQAHQCICGLRPARHQPHAQPVFADFWQA